MSDEERIVLSPALCRAGRGLLDLSQHALAKAARVGRSTVADYERGSRVPHYNRLIAIQEALEAAGVTFLTATETTGAGVRYREPERWDT